VTVDCALIFMPLVPACAGAMPDPMTAEPSCALAELGHWLINKREAQRSFDMWGEKGTLLIDEARYAIWRGTTSLSCPDYGNI
jgi:hypothetical protein